MVQLSALAVALGARRLVPQLKCSEGVGGVTGLPMMGKGFKTDRCIGSAAAERLRASDYDWGSRGNYPRNHPKTTLKPP